ncbi:hypothetical protein EMPS_08490 [Entomortierella parvispora]|uniref:Uncharacterized protein n=1 Tax=Entomortierella parvispora TaxID=205924 RepID=A0A9P3HGG9_9FUNG|nr:hypothetical protein EMPS_08490 [Entomortierella parvispora]
MPDSIPVTTVVPRSQSVCRDGRNPLHVPEILNMVASHIHNSSGKGRTSALASCLQVSWSFYWVFAPRLWAEITLLNPFSYPSGSLLANARFVQSLRLLSAPWRRLLKIQFPHLTSLEFEGLTWMEGSSRALIRKHSATLKMLDLGCGPPAEWNPEAEQPSTLDTLPELPTLQNLKIFDAALVGAERTTAFWTLCGSQLLELTFMYGWIFGTPSQLESASTTRLRKVHLRNMCLDQESLDQLVRILTQSPDLEELTWDQDGVDNLLSSLVSLIKKISKTEVPPLWPHLKKLKFVETAHPLGDQIMGKALGCLSFNLQVFSIHCPTFGAHSARALLAIHSGTLTHLCFDECSAFTSAMLNDCLCSCERLVSVQADGILASDIVQVTTRPWLCQDLRQWGVPIYMDQKDAYQQVFQQLSTLKHVQDLDLRPKMVSPWYELFTGYRNERIQLQLSLGMGSLETMQELKTLDFREPYRMRSFCYRVKAIDWRWMLSAFSQLKELSMTVDDDDMGEYYGELKRRGITFKDVQKKGNWAEEDGYENFEERDQYLHPFYDDEYDDDDDDDGDDDDDDDDDDDGDDDDDDDDDDNDDDDDGSFDEEGEDWFE